MQAILLATGESLKLQPLTERIPSPMIPVMNRPVMAYTLELLGRSGFKRILVSVNSLASCIESYFGDGSKWGLEVEYILQKDPLGSAGALRWAKSRLTEPFLVMPADEVVDFEITQAVHSFREGQDKASVVVTRPASARERTLLVDRQRWVQAINPDRVNNQVWANTGIYLFDPQVIDLIPTQLPFDLHYQLLPKLLAQNIGVKALPLAGVWNPLDTFQNYAEAQQYFLARAQVNEEQPDESITYRYTSLDSRQARPGIWVGRNTRVHAEAKLTPPVSIGSDAWISREVDLGPGVVVGSNVVIDEGASLRNSIVLDGTYIGKLMYLENRLVYQEFLIDLCTNEKVQVEDPLLLGRMKPQLAWAALKRPIDFLLASLLLIVSLPVTLFLGLLMLFSTGKAFMRVPCQSARPSRRKGSQEKTEPFDLFRFNTRRSDGRLTGPGRWVESWEGQRLPELVNVIKGDLALIGVKPVISEEEYRIRAAWQFDQQGTHAGFTGLWFLQTDQDSSEVESLVADTYYLATRNWSQDWNILFKTLPAWYHRVMKKEASFSRTAGGLGSGY